MTDPLAHPSRPPTPFAITAPLLALAAFAACTAAGTDDGLAAERADSAGLTVVDNPGADRRLDAAFSPLFTMGGDDSGPGAFYQVDAWSLDVLPDGRIAVLDRDNHRVALFDAGGTPLSALGREGEGPGELDLPVSIVAAEDGTLAVFDYAKRALVRFGPDGETLDQRGLDVPTDGYGLAHTVEGLLVASREGERGSRRVLRRLLLLGGSGPTELAAVPQTAVPAVEYPSCGVRLSSLPPLLSPELVWATNGRRTAVVGGAEYLVDVYDGARLVLRIRRDLAPEPADEAAARRWLGEGERWSTSAGECLVPVEEMIAARGVADRVPLVDAVAVSPSGAVWVKRKGEGPDAPAIDLFDATGAYVGTLEGAAAPFPARFLDDGTLLAVEEDELDLQRVVAYRAELPPGLLAGGG